MTKKLEIELTEYPEDLYTHFPSRYRATLSGVRKYSPESFISGFGATPENAVDHLVSNYLEDVKQKEERDRWTRVSKLGVVLETTEVEI